MDYIISAIEKKIEDQDELKLELFKSGHRLSKKVALNLSAFFSRVITPTGKELDIIAKALGFSGILEFLDTALKKKDGQIKNMSREIGSQVQCWESEVKGVTQRIQAIPLPLGEYEKESVLHLLGILNKRCEIMRKVAQISH